MKSLYYFGHKVVRITPVDTYVAYVTLANGESKYILASLLSTQPRQTFPQYK